MVDLFKRTLLAGVVSLAMASPSFASADKPVIGVVVKIGGIPWFNAMEAGIKKKGAELGVKAFMIGPTSADPALQVRAVEGVTTRPDPVRPRHECRAAALGREVGGVVTTRHVHAVDGVGPQAGTDRGDGRRRLHRPR